ncbi:PadR family transcriptional regulator [Cohnella nanjingensis]|uniref:PadR family transcriptional regulator n=1 Tax=Cohnella nanjingensis TaxID=1387779 RepID=A0A7X0VF23_9BACL|nr:PadR family transcriptional regulator [Cohnella nanjingensis]MBB6671620.1 PadR family transcriptional regulator [Cohnella nanjingensis]
MYELFALGELRTGDKHGYMLQEVLKRIGTVRAISSGTLYPLLSRLTDEGSIHLRLEEETEGGRPKKIYSLTESGRERFAALMAKPLAHNAETALVFRIKMVYFRYVPKTVRLACLTQYLDYLRGQREYVSRFERQLIAAQPEPEIQRIQLLRTLDHRKHMGAADLDWVRAEIARVEASDPDEAQG